MSVARKTLIFQYFQKHRYLTSAFDRPQFKRMMEEIKAGNIDCVITKDLSRFGREHIMMGCCLEFVFPKLKVRYIAVNDNEDTDRGLSNFVPFKNPINEFMEKDTSRKSKAAFRAKFLNGKRVNSMAPFGYVKASTSRWDLRMARHAEIMKLAVEKSLAFPPTIR